MKAAQAVIALAALAQDTRLAIYRLLVQAGDGGKSAGAIAERLGLPGATLSFHLKELAASGLVTHERASRNLVYRAEMAHINNVLGYLTRNCTTPTDAGAP